MEKTIESLLAPRVKVTIDAPGAMFVKDEIAYVSPDGTITICEDWGKYEIVVADYPEYFSPLPWYAERSEEEMPEYLKTCDGIIKIKSWDMGKTPMGWCRGYWYPASLCEPSTESEYLSFLNQKKEQ